MSQKLHVIVLETGYCVSGRENTHMAKPEHVLEEYKRRMEAIHRAPIEKVAIDLHLVPRQIDVGLLLCNFGEYLSYEHEKGYQHQICLLSSHSVQKSFLVSFNEAFYVQQNGSAAKVISYLHDMWHSYTNSEVTSLRTSRGAIDLDLADTDIVRSVHYSYPVQELVDSGKDYQLFKVVYPYWTLEPIIPSL